MTVRLSCSIMAHPDRAAQVARLQHDLGRDLPVAWDLEGPPSGNADRVWRTARAGWMLHDPDADWHVLIQDDAVVCERFLYGFAEALTRAPRDVVVSPYLGNGRLVPARWERLAARAQEQGASWVVTNRLMWGVAIAVPTALIPGMLVHADRRGGVPDDMRVAGWAQRHGRDVWYTWPSLVDHLQIPSLTKHKAHDRFAIRHHVGSATEIDWDAGIAVDPMLIRRKGPRSGPTSRRRDAGQGAYGQ